MHIRITHFYLEFDTSFHFNADPDPTFHFNANPELASHLRDANLRPLV
jgi:hypothetical protein